jgi:oxalate decarboxylase
MFRGPAFSDVSLNQWMALTPPELVQGHLNFDENVMQALQKKKSPIVPA